MRGSARRIGVLALAALLALPPTAPAEAQAPPPRDPQPLFSGEDALWAAGFLAAGAALAPLDIHLARRIQDSIPQTNRVLRTGSGFLRVLGFPGSLAITGSLYGAGLALDQPGVAEVGLHATEAILVGAAVTGLAKGIIGRARPFLEPDDPFNLGFGRGFTHDRYQAFPSGHTTVAFATAAAITTEVGDREPELKLLTGTVLYSMAALVGVSRMYHNAHWASDVVIGAAVGTFAGWKVVRYHQTHPDNWVDETLLSREAPRGPPVPIVLTWRF